MYNALNFLHIIQFWHSDIFDSLAKPLMKGELFLKFILPPESEEVLKDLSESEKFLQEVCAKAGFKNKQGLQLEELQRVHSKCEEKNAKLRKEMNEKAEQNVEFIRKVDYTFLFEFKMRLVLRA